jgi:hypothetical protein
MNSTGKGWRNLSGRKSDAKREDDYSPKPLIYVFKKSFSLLKLRLEIKIDVINRVRNSRIFDVFEHIGKRNILRKSMFRK